MMKCGMLSWSFRSKTENPLVPPAGDKRVLACGPARSSRAGWPPSADGGIPF